MSDNHASTTQAKSSSALWFFGGCIAGVTFLYLLNKRHQQPHARYSQHPLQKGNVVSNSRSSQQQQQQQPSFRSEQQQQQHPHSVDFDTHRNPRVQFGRSSQSSSRRHSGTLLGMDPESASPFSDQTPKEQPFATSPSNNNTGIVIDLDPSPSVSRGQGVNRQRRATAFSAPSTNLDETREYRPDVHAKSTHVMDLLIKSLSQSALFDQQNEAAHRVSALAMHQRSFRKGELITAQGKLMKSADHCFYVVLEGEVAVIEDATVRRVLLPGAIFGEPLVMFLQDAFPLTHRVETESCVCAVLHQEQFRHIVTQAAVDKMTLYKGFLDRVEWLGGLSKREKIQLADCLQTCRYDKGEYLIEYGTVGVWLFIILEGTVSVQGRRQGEAVHVCSFGPGDCIGELEFLNHHRTVADVRAEEPVKAAKLHRDHFELCMGPITDVLRRTARMDEKYAYYRWATDVPSPTLVHGGFDPA